MQRTIHQLQGFDLIGPDDKIGHVSECYFDDQSWAIRYVVADTGNWLTGKLVLISPVGVQDVDWGKREVHVSMTKEQVEKSPDIPPEEPLSRRHEREYYRYYGWMPYWGGAGLWGPGAYPGVLYNPPEPRPEEDEEAVDEEEVHLRSSRAVQGYRIFATDGDMGHVDDYVFDDRTWQITYLVVDTRNWLPGKKVLLPPRLIRDVSWEDMGVVVSIPRDKVKDAPGFDPDTPLTPEYERSLEEYYGQRASH